MGKGLKSKLPFEGNSGLVGQVSNQKVGGVPQVRKIFIWSVQKKKMKPIELLVFFEITLKQRIHIDSNAVKRKTPEKSSRQFWVAFERQNGKQGVLQQLFFASQCFFQTTSTFNVTTKTQIERRLPPRTGATITFLNTPQN